MKKIDGGGGSKLREEGDVDFEEAIELNKAKIQYHKKSIEHSSPRKLKKELAAKHNALNNERERNQRQGRRQLTL